MKVTFLLLFKIAHVLAELIKQSLAAGKGHPAVVEDDGIVTLYAFKVGRVHLHFCQLVLPLVSARPRYVCFTTFVAHLDVK